MLVISNINCFLRADISGSSGGLISKVLLANADALCASTLPLIGVDDFSVIGAVSLGGGGDVGAGGGM